eukprot:3445295-Alexandrium_andersonii.AAC.1
MVALGPRCPCLLVSFFAWVRSNSTHSKEALNSSLMSAISEELAQWPEMPHVVMGDLNGPARENHAVWWHVQSGNWFDVGSRAS